MGRVEELRNLASWGNIGIQDRLNLLTFCINEALASDVVHEEADRVLKLSDEKTVQLEKRIAALRDEAAKEVKAIFKQLVSKGVGTEDEEFTNV
ncbi:hypothetical protein AGDE_15063 [Angomonas deanei]|nr:hypothetical protein AGDE_15063 [Angomonas deanei]|eukprot:EPY19746.1 hypothetical protein AGDE_15063 [Angomonas deanei]